MKQRDYTVDSLQKLEGLEGIRRRPGMYIGDTETKGLHHLIEEIVDNSIDEVMAGYCSKISITLNENGSVVIEDNGRGIPVAIHNEYNVSGVELVLCHLHAGGKFDNVIYKTAAGLHGVGAKAVNALSSELICEVYRDNGLYKQVFKYGKPHQKLRKLREVKGKTGTRITFTPDKDIFKRAIFNYSKLSKRLRQLAFLNSGVEIQLSDCRTDPHKNETFRFKGGLKTYLQELTAKEELVHPNPIILEDTIDNVVINIALQFTKASEEQTLAFVNNVHTVDGGTHVTGFFKGLTRTLNAFVNEKNLLKKTGVSLSGSDWREGLYTILNIRIPDPQFESQTKVKLTNPAILGIVESSTNTQLGRYCSKNTARTKDIVQKAIDSAVIREAAKKAREKARIKIKSGSATLPSKLYDCRTQDIEKRELFIVEGASAAGSSAEGRDSSFQAILPLQGKILNVEKGSKSKIAAHTELIALIDSIGGSIDDKLFDIDKVRYGKIIIMTDADIDGSHIRCLLLTFFLRQMKELVKQGRIYIAHPPLYALSYKGEKRYIRNDIEKTKILAKLFNAKTEEERNKVEREGKAKIQRFKGLGEMNPQQLWDTTMNPMTRNIEQVKLDQAEYTDEMCTVLMGSDANARRAYIVEHAIETGDLDI